MIDVFVRQVRLAVRRGLPLVVHSRDAVEDVLMVLREHVPERHRIYLHSFMGTLSEVATFLDTLPECYIGIAGGVTWPVAELFEGGLAHICRALPLERLLL